MLALIISIVGAFLGLASFYLTQLRPPKIRLIVEKRLRIGYTGGRGFQFYIPLTFVNRSSRTGVVHKITLVVHARGTSEPVYCIDLARFSEMDDKNHALIDVALPHAFAVAGQSSVAKLARFTWWDESEPPFIFGHHDYDLDVHVWTRSGLRPDTTSHHLLAVSPAQADELERARLKQAKTAIEVALDHAPPNNRTLSPDAIAKAFGHRRGATD